MNLYDAFEFGFDRIQKSVRNCEEKRLDPPAGHMIQCLYCQGKGYYGARRDAPDAVECDICAGHGEMEEPEEWREDSYWEARWDAAKEARESEGAP